MKILQNPLYTSSTGSTTTALDILTIPFIFRFLYFIFRFFDNPFYISFFSFEEKHIRAQKNVKSSHFQYFYLLLVKRLIRKHHGWISMAIGQWVALKATAEPVPATITKSQYH